MNKELLRIELDNNKREARILAGAFIVAKIYCVTTDDTSHLLVDTGEVNTEKNLTENRKINQD